MESVRAFGIGKIVLIILVLAAVLWFFVLAPKPGSLTVSVQEQDSGLNMEGVQVDKTLPDGKPRSKFTDDAGSVVFLDVPGETDVSVRVRPPSTHQSASRSLRISSGNAQDLDVKLGRSVKLELSSETASLSLGADCSTSVPVSVRNLGADAADVSLVGDGALSGRVSSESVLLQGGASAIVSALVQSPSETGASGGGIRVKFTNEKVPLALDVTAPAELEVRPDRISERAPAGLPLKKLLTVSNRGREGVLRDLRVEVTGEIVSYVPAPQFSDSRPLGPGEQTILTLIGDVPNVPGQKLVGVLLVSSACKRVSVPIELDVQ